MAVQKSMLRAGTFRRLGRRSSFGTLKELQDVAGKGKTEDSESHEGSRHPSFQYTDNVEPCETCERLT